MTLDKGNTDKLSEFRNEAKRLGIKVEPPSVNHSGVDFEVQPDGQGGYAIRYALSAVKGVGEGQAQAIVATRGASPFRDLADFARRINPREVNKKVLESLAAAGAFDELEPDRARAFAGMETILAVANRTQAEAAAGQSGLFSGGDSEPLKLPRPPAWPPAERLRREFESVGFFLSGHPLDDYGPILQRLRVERWADFARAVKKGASAARLAATVLDRQERRTKTGNKMGIVTLSDPSGQYEAIMFQEALNQYRDMLEKGSVVLVTLQANVEGEDVRARIATVEPLGQGRQPRPEGPAHLRARPRAAALARATPDAARRGRGVAGHHAGSREERSGSEAARPLPGEPADCRRHQGHSGHCCRGARVGRFRRHVPRTPHASRSAKAAHVMVRERGPSTTGK